jgi:hypothetical protein
MGSPHRWWLFLLFFISGFSSLGYQVVWTRMAFASFGIIAPGGIGAQRERCLQVLLPDAARILNNSKGHIVIDDGRRYLKRNFTSWSNNT